MTKKTTRAEEYSGEQRTLFLVLELGWTEWKLGFSTGLGQKVRSRRMPARDCDRLTAEILEAKRRFAVSQSARVVSCYEAGAMDSGFIDSLLTVVWRTASWTPPASR